MPKRYEAMRDKFLSEGMSERGAKTKAAKIHNATRRAGEAKVTRKHSGSCRKGKK